jgi:hypothetical protein
MKIPLHDYEFVGCFCADAIPDFAVFGTRSTQAWLAGNTNAPHLGDRILRGITHGIG